MNTGYYSRQTTLPEVGVKGQRILNQTHVLVVGAGGLGHPTAAYLAAAGVGFLTIMDFDKVETSNLNRQILFTPKDINKNKASVLAERIERQNPHIKVKAISQKLTIKNISSIISSFSVLLDCTDDITSKFLLHDLAWIQKKNLVQASIHQYEGHIHIFPYKHDRTKGCLRCLWPLSPSPDCVNSCEQAGLIGAVAGVLGTWQAMEAVKTILQIGTILNNTTVMVDLLNSNVKKVHWQKNPSCPLCSSEAKKPLSPPLQRHELSHPDKNYILIDIREQNELDYSQKWKTIHRPLSSYPHWKNEIDPSQKYLFICQKGIRSSHLVKNLRKEYGDSCYSLHGGWDNVRH